MEKIKISSWEEACPDTINVLEWNVSIHYTNKSTFPLLYIKKLGIYEHLGLTHLVLGERGEGHIDVERSIKVEYEDDVDEVEFKRLVSSDNVSFLRIFVYDNNYILTSWTDSDEIINELKTVFKLLKSNDFIYFGFDGTTFRKIEHELPMPVDIDNLQYWWEETEEVPDEKGNVKNNSFACREYVKTLINGNQSINKADDTEQRLFHLMTPQEKAEYLKNNDEKNQERINYFKEGEKSWDAKHPGWDPAQYHLAFYQENKTIKLGEKDIRKIVEETLKRVLKKII